jgi:hypothetical protein
MSDLVYSPNAPLSNTLSDVRVPSAQAQVDGLGNSVGFGAAPYPGDTAVSAPGLAASALCSNAQQCQGLPPYPLIATSAYPSKPNDVVDAGAFRLVANSTATTASGEATAGGAAQTNSVGRLLAHADAKGDPDTQEVTADATSTTDVISVGGVLRIGSVVASAHAELTPDGNVKKQTTCVVDGVSVAGVAAQITPTGVQVAGQKRPLDLSPVASALKAAGITAQLVQPTETATSVTSGAVVVTQQQTVHGQAFTHTYTFGGANAAVTAVTVPTTTAVIPSTPLVSAPAPTVPGATSGTPATAGSTIPGTPSRTIPGPTVQPPTAPLSLRGLAAFSRMWTAQFYLILVVAGLVILGGARLTTTLAVRRTWTS